MTINGREIHFRRSVLVTCMLAEKAPGKDARRYEELWNSDNLAQNYDAAAFFIYCMNVGYEKWAKYNDPAHEEKPIDVGEIMSLEQDEFLDLFNEAVQVFAGDAKQTVKAQPKKGKKTAITAKSG